ncbi:MAG: Lipoate-protein ligase A, partial [uncultured Thermomicrobiales bacterium]
ARRIQDPRRQTGRDRPGNRGGQAQERRPFGRLLPVPGGHPDRVDRRAGRRPGRPGGSRVRRTRPDGPPPRRRTPRLLPGGDRLRGAPGAGLGV